jgi:ABC-type oligopeptide transport system substrate-binding subunit
MVWGIADKELDQWMDDSRVALDEIVRSGILKKIQQRIADLAVMRPLVNLENVYVVKSDLKFTPRVDGTIHFSFLLPKQRL